MDEHTIVNAADAFGKCEPKQLVTLTIEQILELGVLVFKDNQVVGPARLRVVVPLDAQHKLVEYVKSHGFGASRALDALINAMLDTIGFTGDIEFQTNPETFDWVAKEKSPKGDAGLPGEPGAPAPQTSSPVDPEMEKVVHASGAGSSHFSPYSFYNPFEGAKLTCQRFRAGNLKYENGTTVYADMNWLKAFTARDVAFFRDRAGHAVEHLIAEMHGNDDDGPGGNLGAVGWWVEVFAFVKANDPAFYAVIQGKCHPQEKAV